MYAAENHIYTGSGIMSVLAIGQIVYDLRVELDEFPRENSKYQVDESLESGGGPASNAAFLLSKWGVETTLCGRIGADLYGEKILTEFKGVKTDTSLIKVLEDYCTSLSVIMVNKINGSRTVINRKMKYFDLDIDFNAMKKKPEVIIFDGHELEASLAAREKYTNAVTVLDAGSVREGTLKLAPVSDYFICSEKFALEYCEMKSIKVPEDTAYVIEKLRKLTPGKIVVTLGDRGLIYEESGKVLHMKAFPAHAVDTTGAGDIFHGAFVYGILQKLGFVDNLRMASMTSAVSVEKIGGRNSVPELIEVLQRLKKISGSGELEL